jgi:pseudouridylate synthase
MMFRRGYNALTRIWPNRTISSLVHVSPEVQSAVSAGSPVVALESTIITHGLAPAIVLKLKSGMPYPRNLETAISVESIIRKHGAIPATIGCLNGRLFVGMTASEIEVLARTLSATKISRRDIAVAAARGLTGGTTIAGTMVLAHMAGIKVFATGVDILFLFWLIC